MFYIYFGSLWTLITAFVTYGFYGNLGGTIRVNGAVVSQAEFSAMLGPKIFIGIFWFIGISVLIKGIITVKKDSDTENKGELAYGRITRVYKSGTYINNRPEYKIDAKVFIPSTFETTMLSEVIGFNRSLYPVGTYVEVKYYNNDINIVRMIDLEEMPSHIADRLYKETASIDDQNTIIIDGVEYVRKDSLDRL